MHGGHVAEHDVGGTAFGHALVEVDALLGDGTVACLVTGGHRREHDAVLQGHMVDLERFEQGLQCHAMLLCVYGMGGWLCRGAGRPQSCVVRYEARVSTLRCQYFIVDMHTITTSWGLCCGAPLALSRLRAGSCLCSGLRRCTITESSGRVSPDLRVTCGCGAERMVVRPGDSVPHGCGAWSGCGVTCRFRTLMHSGLGEELKSVEIPRFGEARHGGDVSESMKLWVGWIGRNRCMVARNADKVKRIDILG